jgi:hypothetical protein
MAGGGLTALCCFETGRFGARTASSIRACRTSDHHVCAGSKTRLAKSAHVLCLFDFIKYPLRCDMPRSFGQLLLGLRFDLYLMSHLFQQARDHGKFVFGKQTNLQIKVRPFVGFRRHPILRDQDEGRKENRFHRSDHRKHDETFVPCGNAGQGHSIRQGA